MSISKTDICNMALVRVGAKTITNITDDSAEAKALNKVYEISLRSALSETCWNFAVKRKLLATADTTFDWYFTNETYIYARPSDCIRIFETNSSTAVWRLEGSYILSDTSGLGIKYVYFLDEASRYPIAFVDALADRLAADIAFLIAGSKTLASEMLEKYEKISLQKALAENAQIGTHQSLLDDEWTNAKYSDGGM
jgi:hypothetical protein